MHNRNRNRKLLISRAPTKAKSQEPAYSQALNQNKIDRQRSRSRESGRQTLMQNVRYSLYSCTYIHMHTCTQIYGIHTYLFTGASSTCKTRCINASWSKYGGKKKT